MTCPDIDRLVADATAGTPGAAERLDAHAAACPACAAEAALADASDGALDGDLACLRSATCPPGVVEASLVAARRSGPPGRPAMRPERSTDRRAVGRRPVWRWVAASAVAVAAVVVALTQFQDDPALPAGPLVAQGPPALSESHVETPEPVGAAIPVPPPQPPSVVAPAPPRPMPDFGPPPAPALRAAEPEVVVSEPASLPPPVALVAPTAADSAAVRADVYLALGLVARARQAAGDAVSGEMRRVSTALTTSRVL